MSNQNAEAFLTWKKATTGKKSLESSHKLRSRLWRLHLRSSQFYANQHPKNLAAKHNTWILASKQDETSVIQISFIKP